jgi:hypothetical protein
MGRDFDYIFQDILMWHDGEDDRYSTNEDGDIYYLSDCRPLATSTRSEFNEDLTEADVLTDDTGEFYLFYFCEYKNQFRIMPYSYIKLNISQDIGESMYHVKGEHGKNQGSYFDNPDQYPFTFKEVLKILN